MLHFFGVTIILFFIRLYVFYTTILSIEKEMSDQIIKDLRAELVCRDNLIEELVSRLGVLEQQVKLQTQRSVEFIQPIKIYYVDKTYFMTKPTPTPTNVHFLSKCFSCGREGHSSKECIVV